MRTDAVAGSGIVAELQLRLEAAVAGALPAPAGDASELARYRELQRDYPRRGGKRVRGTLALLSGAAHGNVEAALPVAVALELFHSWILIHDDIEDDSEMRRGSPALHRQVGMPLALNAGDGLHVHMWERLLEAKTTRPVLIEFARMMRRTAEGQHLDLAWVASGRFDVSEDEYLEMVRLKTAWYTVVSPLALGALVADSAAADPVAPQGSGGAAAPGRDPADSTAAFAAAGLDLGAAFQIRDDVLNLIAEDASASGYGKEVAGDLLEGKRTLILAHFFATAPVAERERARAALEAGRSERAAGTASVTASGPGAELSWLLAALAGRGSIAYAQRRAEELAASGLARLRNELASLPESPAAAAIPLLLESMASRNR